jgi:murein DD-endopeptidase MepM/ murein hydrolase activator NlpD
VPVALGVAGTALLAVGAFLLPSMVSRNEEHASIPQPPAKPAALPAPAVPAAVQEAEPQVRRFAGLVGEDLSASLLRAGVPERTGREYVALLSKAVPLAGELTVDDRFDLVVERNPDGSLGQLLYAGMDRIARADIELMKWTDGKHIIWVNADGVGGDGSQQVRMPVNGRMTSGFGSRFHPILGYQRFHDGVDLAASAGTPIVAAADGRVASAGWAGGYGRAVELVHAGGIETRYGHMSRIAAYPGEMVHRGDVIGYVGSSGLSTGPHLHFEVMKNGRPVNPLSVKEIAGGPGQLEGARLVAFQNQLRSILLAGG